MAANTKLTNLACKWLVESGSQTNDVERLELLCDARDVISLMIERLIYPQPFENAGTQGGEDAQIGQ